MNSHILNTKSETSEYPIFKINGTSNALECGLFKGIPLGGDGFASFFINCMNNPMIILSGPNVNDKEVEDFMEMPFNFYRVPIEGFDASLLLLRGAVTLDGSFENICGATDVKSICQCFLIDNKTYQIRGIRQVFLSSSLRAKLRAMLKEVDNFKQNKLELAKAMIDLISQGPNCLIEKAEYLGKSLDCTSFGEILPI